MMMDLLLITIPIALMGGSLYVLIKGHRSAQKMDQGYTILSALDNTSPMQVPNFAELEAKQLLLEYAEAMNGRYDMVHKTNHTMQWFKKLDEHVQKNRSYYEAEVKADQPIEQLSEKDSNVTSIFNKRR